jgi:hypothetical protein
MGMKLNGTHQLLGYDDVNLLGDNINAIKKNTDSVVHACKEIRLEVNTEKNLYVLISHLQNAVQNCNMKVAIDNLKIWLS